MRWLSLFLALVGCLISSQVWAQTNLFTIAPAGNNNGNAGLEFIQEVTLTGNTQGKISVRFASGTAAGLVLNNPYICMATGAGSINCSDTPVAVTCSALTTCTIASGSSTLDSDYVAYVTMGTDFLICYDIPGPSLTDTTISTGVTGANASYNSVSGRCSSSNRSTGFSQIAGNVWGVSQVNTEASAGATVHNLLLLGAGK